MISIVRPFFSKDSQSYIYITNNRCACRYNDATETLPFFWRKARFWQCASLTLQFLEQRNQLKILQDQQKKLEQQQGRKMYGNSRTTTTTTTPYPEEEKGEESVIEYDYYYYDYDESTEHGNFYSNDEYDPNQPTRIIDPTNAKPPLLPISPPVKTPINSTDNKYRQ